MYETMIENLDKSLFKGKDLELVNKVIKYLKKNDLEFRLEGDSKSAAESGFPRDYKNIDLMITTRNPAHEGRLAVNIALVRAYNDMNLLDAPCFAKNVNSFSYDVADDFDTALTSKIKISTKDPKTNINLFFELPYKI